MKLLIVDDEQDLRELISFATESKLNVVSVTASSGKEAIEMLESDREIEGIICDYTMPNGTGGDVFQYVCSHKLPMPFVLCTATPKDELAEFKEKEAAGFIDKPFSWEKLITTLEKAFEKQLEAPSKEAPYVPIRTSTLARVSIPNVDLYVKLTDEKYVKLIRKGDMFTESDYKTYQKRNITHFFIHKDDTAKLLQKYTEEVMALSQAKNLPWNEGCDILEEAFESVRETVLKVGMTDESQKLADASAKLAIKTLTSLPKISSLLLLRNPKDFLHKHSVLLSYLSCFIASKMGIGSEANLYKLSLAAFLHDVYLKEDLHGRLETGEVKYDPKTAADFRKHPEEAAGIASKRTEIPAEVSDIILHHHERPDGSGIPLGLTAGSIGPLSSVFIVAHDLVSQIWIDKETTLQDFLRSHENEYVSHHFAKLSQTLQSL